MILRGTIIDGRVVVEGEMRLPDGTPVDIRPAVTARSNRSRTPKARRKTASRTDAYGLHRFAIRTGIRDAAAEHDHYIYGTPRRRARA